jgi:hypothetical protein
MELIFVVVVVEREVKRCTRTSRVGGAVAEPARWGEKSEKANIANILEIGFMLEIGTRIGK